MCVCGEEREVKKEEWRKRGGKKCVETKVVEKLKAQQTLVISIGHLSGPPLVHCSHLGLLLPLVHIHSSCVHIALNDVNQLTLERNEQSTYNETESTQTFD